MALFWLSGEAWAAIEPHLPRNQPGANFLSGVALATAIAFWL